jgi:hypothetical protein
VEVMFYEGALDASCTAVTPACSKGALGRDRVSLGKGETDNSG